MYLHYQIVYELSNNKNQYCTVTVYYTRILYLAVEIENAYTHIHAQAHTNTGFLLFSEHVGNFSIDWQTSVNESKQSSFANNWCYVGTFMKLILICSIKK